MFKRSWNNTEIQFLRKHGWRYTSVQLVSLLNHSYPSIKAKASRLKVPLAKFTMREAYNIPLEKRLNCSLAEMAYLAGIIDGEGTITFRLERTPKLIKANPMILIVNTNESLIHWIKVRIPCYSYSNRIRSPRHKLVYVVTKYGFSVYPLLRSIEPFLIIKKRACKLVMEFIELRARDIYNTSLTEEEIEIVREVRKLYPNRYKKWQI